MAFLKSALQSRFLYGIRPWLYMASGLYALMVLGSSDVACICGTILTAAAFLVIYMRNSDRYKARYRARF